MITVRQLMQMRNDTDPWSVTPDENVRKALELMAEKNIGAVLIVENGQMVGIFSERDFARRVIAFEKCSLETPVKEIMTKNMITADPEQTLEESLEVMARNHIRHLPIMEKGRLIGMVSMRDVVEGIIATKQKTIDNLENYILGSGYGQ